MRGLKCVMVLTLATLVSVTGSGAALANGNTTADEPATPQTQASSKTVKRAPVKKAPAPKKKKTTTTKATAPAPKRETSLDKGIALAQQERYEVALPWLQKAVQENPNSAAAWYWYGKCHELTGQFYQAQYFYAKAVKCDPTFEPLSRVVVYPNDPSGKIPLWDPKRPARVYPVPTQQRDGTVVVPPDAAGATKLPSRPARDPELPKVPSYVPPQPGAIGEKGPDEPWQPAVYVPPSRIDTIGEGGENAVYMPPQGPRVAQTTGEPAQPVDVSLNVNRPVQDLSGFQNLLPAASGYQPPTLGEAASQKPVYQPPEPEKPAPAKKPTRAKRPAKSPRKLVKKAPTSSKPEESANAAKPNGTPEKQDLDEPKLPVIPEPEKPILLPKKRPGEPAQPQQQPAKTESQGQAGQPEQGEQNRPPAQIEREEFLPPVGQRYD